MEGGSTNEVKKAICRSLTNVVKASPLKDAIDPKAFFMMVNVNFGVLFDGGTLNLTPIWDALAAKHQPETLYGLFLKFNEAARQLGLSVGLPAPVSRLSMDEQQLHINLYNGKDLAEGFLDPSGLTPLVDLEPSELQPEGMTLNTGDLKPLVTDDLKRNVTRTVVQGIKSAPVGAKVESAQLGFMIDSNFDALCDGMRFDFAPVLDGLRALDDVADSDIYGAMVRIREQLAAMNITLDCPELNVDPAIREILVQQATRQSKDDIRAIQRVTTSPTLDVPPPGAAVPHQPERKKEALKRFGLGKSDDTFKYVRMGVLAIALLSAGAYGWLTRPSRVLVIDEYNAVMPMLNAAIDQGTFAGTIDISRWHKLKYAERAKSVHNMGELLAAKGLMINMQVRDIQNRLLITSVGPKITPAKVLMMENLPKGDTSVPVPEDPPKGGATASGAPTPPTN